MWFRKSADRRSSDRKHAVTPRWQKRPHSLERLEERTLLAITPMSSVLRASIERASNLGNYSVEQIQATTDWVVGFDQANPQQATLAQGFGGTSLGGAGYLPNSYIWSFPQELSGPVAVSFLSTVGANYFYPLVEQQIERMFVPNDPLFADQWHLRNTGQSGGIVGTDANVVPAWDTVRGNGVVIGIVDDGLEYTHPDLAPAYLAALSYDFADNDNNPIPTLSDDNHGTSVAGVAGARGNNGIGVSGSAPGANLAGIRLIGGSITDAQIAGALSWQSQQIDIYNNSWGPGAPHAFLSAAPPMAIAALENGVLLGRGGLGSIQLFAAGNGLLDNSNVNYNGFGNSRYVIAVSAIGHDGKQSWYSEPGAAILIASYSEGDQEDEGLTTVDRVGDNGYAAGDYNDTFNGTSAATPLASGVVALMLEANPNLTWRDVKHILVNTARKNDPTDPDWRNNAAGFHINHKYGLGAIDAGAAVAMAQSWTNVGPEMAITSGLKAANRAIPDNNNSGVSDTITVTQNIKIETIEIVFNATHTYRGDLQVVLTSPSGVQSILALEHLSDGGADYDNWVFTTNRNWGEMSQGNWTLTVSDREADDTGTFVNWQLNFYGTSLPVGNQSPVANPDTVTTMEEVPVNISVLTNDTDSDGTLDLTTLTIVTQPANGTLQINPGGVVRYTPKLNFYGTDTFTYTIRDNEGAVSNPGTVTINVTNVNDAPIAVNDTLSMPEQSSLVINVLANDIDDGTLIKSSITLVSLPTHGIAVINYSAGTIRYTPDITYIGIDSFKYTVRDNSGLVSNQATVTIDVLDVNLPPVAVNESAATAENTPVTINVAANDSDPDGTIDPTSVAIVKQPDSGTAVVNANGSITYTPNTGFAGGDTIVYRVRDEGGVQSNEATVRLRVGAAVALGGYIYGDVNANGLRDAGEPGIPNVQVMLEKTDGSYLMSDSVQSGPDGFYYFSDLPAGKYNLNQIHPGFFQDGVESPSGGVLLDFVGDDYFSGISLSGGTRALDFNFAELGLRGEFVSSFLSRRLFFATAGSTTVNPSQGDVFFSFDQGLADGLLASASAAGGTVKLTLLDKNLHVVSDSVAGGIAQLNVAGLAGNGYFLRVSGTSNNVTVSLAGVPAAGTAGPVSMQSGDADAVNYVRNLYHTILKRVPANDEILYWAGAIERGTPATEVGKIFVNSYERRAGMIKELYVDYLGREADAGGITFWLGVWDAHKGPEVVQAGIIGSQEYYETAGNTDESWVKALYQNILGREVEPGGLEYWVNFIKTNSKESVVLGFVRSDEYRRGLINGWYNEFLDRDAEQSGQDFWLGVMRTTNQEALQLHLLGSNEFRVRKIV